MRIVAGLALCLSLSACIGEGGGAFTSAKLTGRIFGDNQAPAVLSTLSSGGPVGTSSVAVAFDPDGAARVQIDGTVTAVTFDPAFGGYVDRTGTIGLLVGTQIAGAKPTPDVLYLSVFDSSSSFADAAIFLVVGNNTPAGQLPTNGRATYDGRIFMLDGAGQSAVGDLALVMNFPASQLSGGFSGALPSDRTAAFQLVPARVSGGAFRTTLTSTDVTVTDSAFNGNFFGTFGDQIGGTVLLQTLEGNAVGQFGAAD